MAYHSDKKCRKCKYRASENQANGCDYFFITGKLRGGNAKNCIHFEKGAKIKTVSVISLK